MSWLSSSKSSEPKSASDGGFVAPSRSDRTKCWAARDAFFACLDRHGIVDSIQNSGAAESHCGQEEKVLQKDCASSWVRHTTANVIVASLLTMSPGNVLQAAQSDGAQEAGYATELERRGCTGSARRIASRAPISENEMSSRQRRYGESPL